MVNSNVWSVMKGIILFTGLIFLLPFASATTISFDCLTNNSIANAAAGESQLSVDVTAYGTNQILFTFINTGTVACSITDVYFDNGNPPETLSWLAGLIDRDEGTGGSTGVDFSRYADPTNLPGAVNANPDFVTTLFFSADSDSKPGGILANGVNPGEKLGVIFNLLSGETFDSVVAAMTSGDLRIGIHVQGFANGGSESFIGINPPGNSMVPEPGTISLITMGLISLVSTRKRRSA